jgi:hypothetical protein
MAPTGVPRFECSSSFLKLRVVHDLRLFLFLSSSRHPRKEAVKISGRRMIGNSRVFDKRHNLFFPGGTKGAIAE